jgi:hypothetical protein
MVQPAKNRMRNNVSESLDRTSARRVLPKRNVSPRLIVIGRIFGKNSPKVLGVDDDQIIGALAADRADQALNMSILPRRTQRRGPVPDPHRSDAGLECNAERSVVVANEIFRCAVPWKRFGDLARQPLGRRIAGHRKPQQPPPLVPENQKCEQLLKGNRRNYKQTNRRNPFYMIAKEGLPGLQWPTSL